MTARPLRSLVALLLLSPAFALLAPAAPAQSDFIRGNANGAGGVDIADAIYALAHLFAMGPSNCTDAIDSNDDGQANLADPIYSLAYQFGSGPPPAPPFPACGADPTPDAIGCVGPVASCTVGGTPTAFRLTSFEIRDPHLFTQFLVCVDSTNSVNGLLSGSIDSDADMDGLVDQSFLLIFRPVDPAGPGGPADFLQYAACTTPVATTTCDDAPGTVTVPLAVANSSIGTCLAPVAGTTSGYSPQITTPTAPCFSTAATLIGFDLAGVVIPLQSARIGGTYIGSPVTSIENGLGYGFLSEATADQIILPPTLALVGGLPLSTLLPGGTGNCSATDDRDLGPGGSTLGWWIYFNFTAVQVPYIGP